MADDTINTKVDAFLKNEKITSSVQYVILVYLSI